MFPLSLCCVTVDELYDATMGLALYLADIKGQSVRHSMRTKRSEAELVRAEWPGSSASVLLTSHARDFYLGYRWGGRQWWVGDSKKNFIELSTPHVLGNLAWRAKAWMKPQFGT